MSPATGKKVIEYLGDSASINDDMIIVDFINGEPLLNFETMKYMIEFANQYEKIKGKKTFIFRYTTNGSLLTEDILDFTIKNGIQFNLSVDGIPESHDKNRVYPGGLPTSVDVHKKLHWLSDLENVSVISTFTPKTCQYMYESIKYFMDYKIRNIGFSFIQGQINYNSKDRNRCLREFSKSIDLLLYKYKNNDFYFSHVELDNYLRIFFSRAHPVTKCSYPYRITVSGDIENCDRIPKNLDIKIGSIYDAVPHKANHFCENIEILRCKHCNYRDMCSPCIIYAGDIFQREGRTEEPFSCAVNKMIIDKARRFFMSYKNDPIKIRHFDQSKTFMIRLWRFRVANAEDDIRIKLPYNINHTVDSQVIKRFDQSNMSNIRAKHLLVTNAINENEINPGGKISIQGGTL